MNDNFNVDRDYIEEFGRNKKYRFIGLLIAIASIIPYIVYSNIWGLLGTVVICGFGLIILRKYKCPACHSTIPARHGKNEMKHCPNCGVLIDI